MHGKLKHIPLFFLFLIWTGGIIFLVLFFHYLMQTIHR